MRSDLDARDRAPLWINDDHDDDDGILSESSWKYLEEEEEMGRGSMISDSKSTISRKEK